MGILKMKYGECRKNRNFLGMLSNTNTQRYLKVLGVSLGVACLVNSFHYADIITKDVLVKSQTSKVEQSYTIPTSDNLISELSKPEIYPSEGMSKFIDSIGVYDDLGTEESRKDALMIRNLDSVETFYSLSDFRFNDIGYTTANLNLRSQPNMSGEVLSILSSYSKIYYQAYDSDWLAINFNGRVAFLSSDYISDEAMFYKSLSVCGDMRKSYMDYTAIKKKSSPQYKLQQLAVTSDNGIRTVNDRYLVALGSYYTKNVGQYVDLVLSNGTVIECVLGDCKADQDTNENNSVGNDGSVAEFIVQTSALDYETRKQGDCSLSEDSWNSNVVEIRLYDIDAL